MERTQQLKSIRLTNHATGKVYEDTLHNFAVPETECSTKRCYGSFMNNVKPVGPVRSEKTILKEAKPFIDEFYKSIGKYGTPAHAERFSEIECEVMTTKTYNLTITELTYGAKLAWRNAARCIGRIQWSKLQVFDARYVGTAQGMFEAICDHLRYATNNGNLRSAITVFPHRISGRCDFRVWNFTFIGYAGYKQPDGSVMGDPANVELTEVCQRLGWVGKGTQFDVLPLVVQAGDGEAKFFEIPEDLVLEVPLVHPNYPWFEQMGLKWFAVPGVSCLKMDCGGLEFSAIPFNGWYMVTEVGTRDLADPQRYNLAEVVAKKMGLNTSTSATMWRDKAVIELNIAVLHSFQKNNVTIMDHHVSCDTFMKHLDSEFKLRGGCPGDWVWLVPPTAGSLVSVYHQEILCYQLKPSYDYQDRPWKNYNWSLNSKLAEQKKSSKYRFREIARAVRFTNRLFGKVYSRRIRVTILYASETGKSLTFSHQLAEIFSRAFQPQVICMAEYDPSVLEYEPIVLVVASTFGNGESPENGELMARKLQEKKKMTDETSLKSPCPITDNKDVSLANKPLANVRFSVFALGSRAYPKFCSFGKHVDSLLAGLGADRLKEVECGDELSGQEQTFKKWAYDTYKVACDTFCIQDTFIDVQAQMRSKKKDESTVQFAMVEDEVPKEEQICKALGRLHMRQMMLLDLVSCENLTPEADRLETLKVVFSWKPEESVYFEPGDHVGIQATNRSELVDKIIEKLRNCPEGDRVVEVQLKSERMTIAGPVQSWLPHPKLPRSTVHQMLSKFLDITTPPTQKLLAEFALRATDQQEKTRLTLLSTNTAEYETWKHWKWPTLLEVFEEFPSVTMDAALLLTLLPLMQSRYYSTSSSLAVHPHEVHLTVGVVRFQTQGGEGLMHYGVCSNYLRDLQPGARVSAFFRRDVRFHLPSDPSAPIVMVGPGTGIAPFRSFWEELCFRKDSGEAVSSALLLIGCRTRHTDLYRDEKQKMSERGVLTIAPPAYSRDPGLKKTYVQHRMVEPGMSSILWDILVSKKGHFYFCGDGTMADDVHQSLKTALCQAGGMTEAEAEAYLTTLQDEGRYHEDVFGITLRAAEVHSRSHLAAKSSAAQP